MAEAFIARGVRTPFGRYGGALAQVRPDDLLAGVFTGLMQRTPSVDWAAVDDVIVGCANQAGEDNRNIGRMSVLLAGLPVEVPAVTMNRLCGSGLEAIITAARAVRAGDADLVIAGGVESMTRAPFVSAKSSRPWSRSAEVYDTTMGWRFVNPALAAGYGADTMPATAENVAREFGVSREDQDSFALRSQQRARAAMSSGRLAKEILPVTVDTGRGRTFVVEDDEHPRDTSLEALGELPPLEPEWSITAGNASGINDGAAAVLIASESAVDAYGLTPLARVTASAVVGVEPRIMGIGPLPALTKLLDRRGLRVTDLDVLEVNEAFAAQALAVTRGLGLDDDADNVNPNGGAIALGHPLGASGARLALTAAIELHERQAARAAVAMCIGVGQGIAMQIERA